MPKFAQLRIRIKADADRPGRFVWSVSDEYSGLFKSPGNFATEREALADAERFVDKAAFAAPRAKVERFIPTRILHYLQQLLRRIKPNLILNRS
jgi:hypothetical protein